MLLLFMSLSSNSSDDDYAKELLQDATDMGINMKLFGVKDAMALDNPDQQSSQSERATAHVAWGAFNLLT
jgi:hypothetical protein